MLSMLPMFHTLGSRMMIENIIPVVTGLGLVSALGRDLELVFGRLYAGDSGIKPNADTDYSVYRNTRMGIAEGEFPAFADARVTAMLETALCDALADAGLDPTLLQHGAAVIGVSFGSIFHNADGPVALDAAVDQAFAAAGIALLPHVVSAACSSSSEAIAMAYDMIVQGEAQLVIAGGVDVIDRYKVAGHSSLSTLSPTTCRPFDIAADGTILGEGAAILIIEHPAHALARHAAVRARLAGVAANTDTNTLTSPDETGTGAARLIVDALRRAGCAPDAVAYVNAHGSGTPVNDAMEAAAFAAVFTPAPGRPGPKISSTKSVFGHTLGATGAVEAIVAIETLARRIAPATYGLANAHACWSDADLVRDRPDALGAGDCAMSVTYGFGGANVALVFQKEQH